MKSYKLYYLTSEIDEMSPRYIGYTTLEIEERLSHHINEAKYEKCKSHKVNWISKILSLGYKPIIVEIERTYTLDDVLLLERNYIEEYSKSYRLTNSTNGGEVSKSFIDSVRDKISSLHTEVISKALYKPVPLL